LIRKRKMSKALLVVTDVGRSERVKAKVMDLNRIHVLENHASVVMFKPQLCQTG
jgi:hypothetical protein